MKEQSRIIKTLYAIRFIFFILIFVRHTIGYHSMEWLAQSGLAVTGFIILSGFLNGYLYREKYDNITIHNIFDFTYKRIKKLYPIHLLMLFIVIGIYHPFNNSFSELGDYFKHLFANMFLIHSWISDQSYYFSFNGVSWFLSTYLFLSFVTVPILYLVNRISKKKKSIVYLIILIFILYVGNLTITHYVLSHGLNPEFYINVFPPSRVFEYSIGIIVGSLMYRIKLDFKYDKYIFTLFELLSVVIFLVFVKYVPNNNYMTYWGSKWVIPSIILFVVFALQKGYISKFISIKPFIILGSSTMIMYLTHQVVIRYVYKSVGYPAHCYWVVLYMFIVSILIGIIITQLQQKKKKC